MHIRVQRYTVLSRKETFLLFFCIFINKDEYSYAGMKNEECFAGMVARMVAGMVARMVAGMVARMVAGTVARMFAGTVGATLVVARPVSVKGVPEGDEPCLTAGERAS